MRLSLIHGVQELSRMIYIEQKLFHTTENTHKILIHLCRDDESRIVWIESDDNTEEMFAFMQGLLHDIQTIRGFDSLVEKYTVLNAWENERKFGLLGRMLSHSWFTRVWIYQEVVVASKARVLCGYYSMPWEIFVEAIVALSESSLDQMLGNSNPSVRDNDSKHDYICQISEIRSRRSSGRELELQKLLLAGLPREAIDQRDRVFSLVRIATDAKDNELSPNYTKSISQLFYETTEFLLCCDKRPYLLQASERERSTDCSDLPSWAPDLSAHADVKVLGWRSDIFNASGEYCCNDTNWGKQGKASCAKIYVRYRF